MKIAAIIAAGGRGTRLGAAVPKQLLAVGGQPMLQLTVEAFLQHPRVHELVVVLPRDLAEQPPAYLGQTAKQLQVVAGGQRRQDSVARGLEALGPDVDVVLIHDAARPFVDASVIDRVIDAASQSGAAICAVQAHDTVKLGEPTHEGPDVHRVFVARTVPRETVFLAQTPQGFKRAVLEDAVRLGAAGVEATDEAFLAEQAGHRVRLVEGSARNMKITSREDLAMAESIARKEEGNAVSTPPFAVGTGYDLHRLVDGRRLVIGGIDIPFERGLLGHSDADVLCHAITDAVLGAAGAGDIGRHFPDTDERWRDASSVELLRQACCVVREAGFAIANVDAVIIAERPKLLPHLPAIVERLAATLHVPPTAVSVKGKTNEGIGETGRAEAIACHAVALLYRT